MTLFELILKYTVNGSIYLKFDLGIVIIVDAEQHNQLFWYRDGERISIVILLFVSI